MQVRIGTWASLGLVILAIARLDRVVAAGSTASLDRPRPIRPRSIVVARYGVARSGLVRRRRSVRLVRYVVARYGLAGIGLGRYVVGLDRRRPIRRWSRSAVRRRARRSTPSVCSTHSVWLMHGAVGRVPLHLAGLGVRRPTRPRRTRRVARDSRRRARPRRPASRSGCRRAHRSGAPTGERSGPPVRSPG